MKKSRLIWTIIRTIVFYTAGIYYTVFIQVEEYGSWENILGYILLFLAIYDTISLIKYFKSSAKH